MVKIPGLLLVLCPLLASAATPVTPYLVRPLNPTITWQHQTADQDLAVNGNALFYTTMLPQPGFWRTDGTAAGTYHVGGGVMSEITTRPNTVNTTGALTWLGRTNELWVTDGSTAGTKQMISGFDPLSAVVPCGAGKFCFSADFNRVGVTDGTAAGTSITATTEPADHSGGFPTFFASLGGRAYFTAFDLAHGQCVFLDNIDFCGELWTSDGTAAGTHLVKDLVPGPYPSAPRFLVTSNDRLYFAAFPPNGDADVTALWTSDGTSAGTHPTSPALYIPRGLPITILTTGDTTWFEDYAGELWRLEKSGEAVRMRDLLGWSDPVSFGRIAGGNDFVVFPISHNAGTSPEMWSWNGKTATKLFDASPSGVRLVGYWPERKQVWFTAFLTGDHRSLFSTDGTPAGTRQVAEFPANVNDVIRFSASANQSFFQVSQNGGFSIWQSDGTKEGTHPVADQTPLPAGVNPSSLIAAGDTLYFFGKAPDNTQHLYRSRGSESDTADIGPCADCHDPWVADGRVYFRKSNFYDVWTTGGSPETIQTVAAALGVQRILGTNPYRAGDALVYVEQPSGIVWSKRGDQETALTTTGDTRIIGSTGRYVLLGNGSDVSSTDGVKTQKLAKSGSVWIYGDRAILYYTDATVWTTDGSVEGLKQLTLADDGVMSLNPKTVWNGFVIYTNERTGHVWATNIATNASSLISEQRLGTIYDGGARFFAETKTDTGTLIVLGSDGTHDGTKVITQISSVYSQIDPFNGPGGDPYVLYLSYAAGGYFLLDLRTGATQPVSMGQLRPMYNGAEETDGRPFVAAGDRLYFAAYVPRLGKELWALPLDGSVKTQPAAVDVQYTGTTTIANGTAAVFTVAAHGGGPFPPRVAFTTVDGAGRAGRDYTTTSGVIEFGQNDSTSTVVVPLLNGSTASFHIVLSAPENAVITNGLATATIVPGRRRSSAGGAQ